MAYTTVRISTSARDLLRTLAAHEGGSMQSVLEKALEVYRRREFLEGINRAYAAVRADRQRWADLEDERATWDATIADGLPDEPRRSRGRAATRRRRSR